MFKYLKNTGFHSKKWLPRDLQKEIGQQIGGGALIFSKSFGG